MNNKISKTERHSDDSHFFERHPNVLLLQERIGLTFMNPFLGFEALVHSSFQNESDVNVNNERLEFLGDTVFNLIVSEYLFLNFPDVSEGTLSKYRCRIISAESCASLSEQLKIGELLILGRGEKLNALRGRLTAYANLFEAVIGAVYLDQGLDIARQLLKDLLPTADKLVSDPSQPAKNELQERVQKRFGILPVYKIILTRITNESSYFEAVVKINDRIIGRGAGNSKKTAKKQAAEDALKHLTENHVD
ncbi:MAG: ribonuclease III [Victivallaceae bacterium]